MYKYRVGDVNRGLELLKEVSGGAKQSRLVEGETILVFVFAGFNLLGCPGYRSKMMCP